MPGGGGQLIPVSKMLNLGPDQVGFYGISMYAKCSIALKIIPQCQNCSLIDNFFEESGIDEKETTVRTCFCSLF